MRGLIDLRSGKPMTRRETLKGLGGIAAILASGQAPAALMRGVGLRTAMGGGGGWTNPYVTDGLIAMWDGEWNAGPGVHDASATVWEDLSGNGFSIILTGATIGSDYVFLPRNCTIGCNLPSVSRPTFTAEIVINRQSANAAALWIANPSWIGGLLIDYQTIGQTYYPWSVLATTAISQNKLSSIQLTYKNGNQKLFIDGVKISENNGSIDNRNVLSRLFLNNYNGATDSTAIYKSIRLNSEWFTDEMLIKNYLIDCARFNLP